MPAEAPDARSLLIVEDDDVFRSRLARAFRDRGFEVREARDVETAAHSAGADPPEYAVVDLRLGARSGLDVVRALVELDPSTVIVVLTGYGSIATALEAVRLGATHYLTKPADVDEILASFERARGAAEAAAVPAPATPSLARVEWEHISRVLADCGGNISQAARVLGIHRRSLQRKLAKYPTPR
jgi:two-component system response regulator RegA